MDLGQAVSGLPGLFHPGQVGVHHLAVPLHGEDQRNVDRNPFRQNGTDGGQTGLSGRDLDEKVRPVDDLPQLDCLLDRFSVSCASRGSTSIDTRPSTPSESSHWGTSTSHALRTSSVVTVRMVASTSAPRAAPARRSGRRRCGPPTAPSERSTGWWSPRRRSWCRSAPADCPSAAGPATGHPATPIPPRRSMRPGWGSERSSVITLPQLSSARSAAAATASAVKPYSRNKVLWSADSP